MRMHASPCTSTCSPTVSLQLACGLASVHASWWEACTAHGSPTGLVDAARNLRDARPKCQKRLTGPVWHSNMIKFRVGHPSLGRAEFLDAQDITWHESAWHDQESRFLAFTLHDRCAPPQLLSARGAVQRSLAVTWLSQRHLRCWLCCGTLQGQAHLEELHRPGSVFVPQQPAERCLSQDMATGMSGAQCRLHSQLLVRWGTDVGQHAGEGAGGTCTLPSTHMATSAGSPCPR